MRCSEGADAVADAVGGVAKFLEVHQIVVYGLLVEMRKHGLCARRDHRHSEILSGKGDDVIDTVEAHHGNELNLVSYIASAKRYIAKSAYAASSYTRKHFLTQNVF